MPKQLHEIKSFNQGTHITPSDTDIPEEAADYSLNIDPMARDGVLKGINYDYIKYFRDADDTVNSTFSSAFSNGAVSVTLADASSFASSGNIIFTDSTGYIQVLSYSGKYSNNLTGVSSWYSNGASAPSGNKVYQYSSASTFRSDSSAIINNDNNRHLIYFDDSDDKIKNIAFLYSGSNSADIPDLNVMSTSAESVTGLPTIVTNNKEVHIGMGTDASDKPLWAGIIGHGQFGSAASNSLQLTDAELSPPSTLPPFDKAIRIGSYLYGAQDSDTKVYAVSLSDGSFHNSSFDIFSSIVSIAYHNATSFWVLDKISTTVAELKLVDATSFEVTQTSTITGIKNYLPSGSETTTAFATWFDSSTMGGGADFITDLIETSGAIWYLRGCGIENDNPSTAMIKKRFLFRSDIPTSTDALVVKDVSPMLEKNANVGAAEEGYFYEAYSSVGASDDTDVMAQIPYKGLVDCGAACGIVLSVYRDSETDGATDGPLSLYLNDGSSGTYHSLRASGSSDGLYPLLFVFHDTKWQNSGRYTQQPIDISTGDDQKSFLLRRFLWGSSGTDYLNKTISCASYDGVSGSTLGVTFHDSDTDSDKIVTQTAIETGTNFVWSDTDVGGNLSLDDNDQPDYEMRSACIVAVDDGTGSTVYLIRGSKDLSENKHQIIKSVNTDGNTPSSDIITYSKESDLSVKFTEIGTDGSWPADTTKVFYKMSYLYDGYQESPLSNTFIHNISAATKRLRLNINIHNTSTINPRITHLNVYSASSTNTGAQGPDGFYRLVESIKLDSGWTTSTSDENGGLRPTWGAIETREYLDDGKTTSSYEARTGISEILSNTLPRYGISTALNNQLFVAQCSHDDIDDAGNYLFKSRPYNYDQFNWASDFLVLPTYPTAITSFNGRIYVFDENNTYRIEPNNLYIEDVLEGVGCFSQRSISVTDYGMCFADRHNVYLHNGKEAQPISISINGLSTETYSWYDLSTAYNPIIRFYNRQKSFLILFYTGSTYRIWSFNTIKRRWDLWEIAQVNGGSAETAEPTDMFVGKNGEINLSINGKLYLLYEDDANRRSWSWNSKKLTLGQATQMKRFNNFHVTGSPSGTLGSSTHGVYIKVDDATVSQGNHSGSFTTFTIPSSQQSAKTLQWLLSSQTGEVDALGVVYRRKIVTAEQ